MADTQRQSTRTRTLRTRAVAALAAVAGAAALVAVPAATGAASAGAAYCGITWGSVAKTSGTTVPGRVTGVRAGRHACYDRLVIDATGRAPGFDVRYVTTVRTDGGGFPVPVAGGARLAVVAKKGATSTAVDAVGRRLHDLPPGALGRLLRGLHDHRAGRAGSPAVPRLHGLRREHQPQPSRRRRRAPLVTPSRTRRWTATDADAGRPRGCPASGVVTAAVRRSSRRPRAAEPRGRRRRWRRSHPRRPRAGPGSRPGTAPAGRP